jgi:hypothetical protein
LVSQIASLLRSSMALGDVCPSQNGCLDGISVAFKAPSDMVREFGDIVLHLRFDIILGECLF